jgi:hypothetical protein
MNIVQLQDQLKNFSQDQLVREMQMPSGSAPQFLVLGEIMRRQKMQKDFTAQQAKGDQGTVAQEAVAAAGVPQGGIADMARAMAPSTDMTQNTGVQAMYAGGPVKKMAKGEKVKTDPAVIAMANRAGMSVGQYLEALGEEEAARVVAGAEQRAARNRMMAMEPVAGRQPSYLDLPTQADLDRSFQEEQFAFDASRPLVAPTAIDMPTVPSVPAQTIGAPPAGLPAIAAAPEMPGAPFYLRSRDVAPEAGTTPTFLERMRSENRMSPPGGLAEDFGVTDVPATPPVPAPEQAPTEFAEQFGTESYDPNTVSPGVMERIFGAPALERIGVETSRTPAAEPPAPSRADRDQQGGGIAAEKAKVEKAAEEKATADAAAAAQTPSGGAGGAGGAGGMSSFEQELMDALGRREKAAEQDKWLALAQVGLNLMSSTQPTLGGALGEAGLKGVEAVRGARDQYDKDRLELLGALEQSRAARAKAAAGGGGLTAYQAATLGRYARQDAISMLGTLYDRLGSLAPTGVPLPQSADEYARTKAQIAAIENDLYGGGAEAESGEAIDVRTKT